jgi:hypothetical protein
MIKHGAASARRYWNRSSKRKRSFSLEAPGYFEFRVFGMSGSVVLPVGVYLLPFWIYHDRVNHLAVRFGMVEVIIVLYIAKYTTTFVNLETNVGSIGVCA